MYPKAAVAVREKLVFMPPTHRDVVETCADTSELAAHSPFKISYIKSKQVILRFNQADCGSKQRIQLA